MNYIYKVCTFFFYLLFLLAHGDEDLIIEKTANGVYGASSEFGTKGGQGIAAIGDLGGDGIIDFVFTIPLYGSSDDGVVFILHMDEDGGFGSYFSIDSSDVGLSSNSARFGMSAARIDDVNNDGFVDVAVSSMGQNANSPCNMGCVHILKLYPGALRGYFRISGEDHGAGSRGDQFGRSIVSIGDWDGNGYTDLLVGASGLDRTGCIIFIGLGNGLAVSDGSEFTLCADEIDSSLAGADSSFGASIAHIKDGVFVVGAPDADGGGAIWLLEIESFALSSAVKIDVSSLGLDSGDQFGCSVEIVRNGLTDALSTSDLDHNAGTYDIAVGTPRDDTVGTNSGAVYILHVYPDGTLQRSYKLADMSKIGEQFLGFGDLFGSSLACFGDLDGDGEIEMAVGIVGFGQLQANNRGGGWSTLYLNPTAFPTASPTFLEPSSPPTTPHPSSLPISRPTPAPTLNNNFRRSPFPQPTPTPSLMPSGAFIPEFDFSSSYPTPLPSTIPTNAATLLPTQMKPQRSYFLTAATVALWGTTFFVICTLGLWTVRLAMCKSSDNNSDDVGGIPQTRNGGNAAAVVPRTANIFIQSMLFEESSAAKPGGDATCPICLYEMMKGEICKELPNCRHVYHTECIDEWLCRSMICPLCRQDVGTQQSRLRVRVRHGRHPATRELEMTELIQMHAASL